MRIPVRPLLVTLTLFLTVALIVLGGLWYQKCNCQPQKDAQGNYEHGPIDLVCSTMERPEALFALALVFCTIVSFGFITTQIKQANAAIEAANRANTISEGALTISKEARQIAVDGLAETRKSVNAFINSERGLLTLRDASLIQAAQEEAPQKDPLSGWSIHFAIENIGRSPAFIVASISGVVVVPNLKFIPAPSRGDLARFSRKHNTLLAPGDRMLNGDLSLVKKKYRNIISLVSTPVAIKEDDVRRVINDKWIFVFVEMVIYRTTFDTHHWYCATSHTKDMGGRLNFVEGPEHNFDVPVEYPITTE